MNNSKFGSIYLHFANLFLPEVYLVDKHTPSIQVCCVHIYFPLWLAFVSRWLYFIPSPNKVFQQKLLQFFFTFFSELVSINNIRLFFLVDLVSNLKFVGHLERIYLCIYPPSHNNMKRYIYSTFNTFKFQFHVELHLKPCDYNLISQDGYYTYSIQLMAGWEILGWPCRREKMLGESVWNSWLPSPVWGWMLPPRPPVSINWLLSSPFLKRQHAFPSITWNWSNDTDGERTRRGAYLSCAPFWSFTLPTFWVAIWHKMQVKKEWSRRKRAYLTLFYYVSCLISKVVLMKNGKP